jgi:hypothetical protein
MAWLALTYSLPSKGSSNPRVTAWRRLQRLGAVSLPGGLYLLPEKTDTLESFQWLAQEVNHAQGEALVIRVAAFEGLSDAEVVAHFNAARRPEYEELAGHVTDLLAALPDDALQEKRLEALEGLEKLRKRHAEISKRDFFKAPEGGAVAAKLAQLSARLTADSTPAEAVEPVNLADFTGKVWVTRPRPFVDRLASAWLIRRFIDPGAVIRYRDTPEADKISFDMPDARFNHVGNLCTFEVLIAAFSLDAPGLRSLAEIVHNLDLQDGRYARPEAAGVEAVLSGWRGLPLTDAELEARGIEFFEGLYQSLAASEMALNQPKTPGKAPKEKVRGRNR